MKAPGVSMSFKLKKSNLSGIIIEKITKQVSSQSTCFEWNDRKLIDLIEKLLTQATTGHVYVTRIAKNNYHTKENYRSLSRLSTFSRHINARSIKEIS